MGKVFGIVSGKGGVGKSPVSVGLGLSFAQKGNSVLLVDMDEGLRCLDLLLCLESQTVFDLSDVLKGKEIEAAVYSSDFCENLKLIPAPHKVGLIEKEKLEQFAKTVSELYDVVIFDFPAGIDTALYSALPKDTLFLTVAVPDPVSVRDAAAMSEVLSENGLEARLIINRFKYKIKRKLRFKNIDDIIDSAYLRLVGIVPESDEISIFSLTHRLPKKCRAAKALSRIAKRLSGEAELLPKIKKI